MKRAISGPNLSGNGRLAAVQREKQLQKCWIPADSVGTEGDVRKAEWVSESVICRAFMWCRKNQGKKGFSSGEHLRDAP